MDIYANYDKNAPSIGEAGLLHGRVNIESNDTHRTRIDNFIYSGDLIQLSCCNNSIPTYYGNDLSTIMMRPPGNQNALTKLRLTIKNKDQSDRSLIPLQYQNEVFIEFNPRGDFQSKRFAINQQSMISFDSGKQTFVLLNPSNQADACPIHLGDQLLIGIKNGNAIQSYLCVKSDNSIQLCNTVGEATPFNINSSIGCGPNWLYDQDTRGLNNQLSNFSDSLQIVDNGINNSSDQLKKQQDDFIKEFQQFNLKCHEQITRETKINETLKKQLSI